MNFKYINELSELDGALASLAKSDSSIEYALHIREPFNEIINKLNQLKTEMGYDCLKNNSDKYFED
jgi:hypothetical protein